MKTDVVVNPKGGGGNTRIKKTTGSIKISSLKQHLNKMDSTNFTFRQGVKNNQTHC